MRTTRTGCAVSIVMLALLMTGCGASSDDTASEPSASESTVTSTPSESATGPAADSVVDLAARLDVDAASIEVVSEEEVTWTDGSLGCAEDGSSYTQSLVEGSRITLRVDGVDYEYHSGGTKEPFLCEQPTQ